MQEVLVGSTSRAYILAAASNCSEVSALCFPELVDVLDWMYF